MHAYIVKKRELEINGAWNVIDRACTSSLVKLYLSWNDRIWWRHTIVCLWHVFYIAPSHRGIDGSSGYSERFSPLCWPSPAANVHGIFVLWVPETRMNKEEFCCYLGQNLSLLACLGVSFRELQHPICIIHLYVINQDNCAGLERVSQTQNPSKTLTLFNLKFVWTTKKGKP